MEVMRSTTTRILALALIAAPLWLQAAGAWAQFYDSPQTILDRKWQAWSSQCVKTGLSIAQCQELFRREQEREAREQERKAREEVQQAIEILRLQQEMQEREARELERLETQRERWQAEQHRQWQRDQQRRGVNCTWFGNVLQCN